jgi:putative ATP-binding cassette transporter
MEPRRLHEALNPRARAHPSDAKQRTFSQVRSGPALRLGTSGAKPLNRFDRTFWRRAWSLLLLYWRSAQRRYGIKLLAGVAVLAGVGLAIGAYATYLSRDITDALIGKHLTEFYRVMLLAAGAAAVGMLARVFQQYLGGILYIEWREWLTNYFVDRGFAHRAFYRMGRSGKVDNPDQRISDDLGSLVEATETFTIKLVFAIAGVVTYFAIIWSISSAMALFLIAYATVGTYFSALIGRRLVGLNYYQERFQADFRFGLVHVRNNVEPIFIYRGERHETDQLHHRFAKVVSNFKQLILWKRNLGFFTESYGDLARDSILVPCRGLRRWPARVRAGGSSSGRVRVAARGAFNSRHQFSEVGQLRQRGRPPKRVPRGGGSGQNL